MSISDIRHQARAIDTLQRGFQCDRLAHGYVFSGPEGIGKELTARQFAKVLLCGHRQKIKQNEKSTMESWLDSCGSCQSCKLVDASTHPDYHLIYKELITLISGKERHKATELGIDVIRQELVDKAQLRPSLGDAKVFVILEAHKLSRSAQNAMLKTLEEPPPGTYIILVTQRLGDLLPTIRSRTQTVRFGLLTDEFVTKMLADAGADGLQQRFFSKLVPGQAGLALELYELGVYDLNERLGKDLAVLELASSDDLAQWVSDQSKELVEKMQAVYGQDVIAKPSESELTRMAMRRIMGLLGGFYQDALRVCVGLDRNWVINDQQITFINQLAADTGVEKLQGKLDALRDAQALLDRNVNQNLLLSGLMAGLAD